MLTMIGKRLMFAIPSLIGVVIVTFLLTRALPGDPAAYFAGPAATKEAIEQIRKKLGLDKPLIEQFFRYTSDLAHCDFGNSLTVMTTVISKRHPHQCTIDAGNKALLKPTDEVKGRPVPVAERIPDRIVVVDRDREADPQVIDSATHVVDVPLEVELGSVHADDRQPVARVSLDPGADVGKRAEPVDAGVGQELDQNDAAV